MTHWRVTKIHISPSTPPIFHLLYAFYSPCFLKYHQTKVRHLWSLVKIFQEITWGMKCVSEHNRFVCSFFLSREWLCGSSAYNLLLEEMVDKSTELKLFAEARYLYLEFDLLGLIYIRIVIYQLAVK